MGLCGLMQCAVMMRAWTDTHSTIDLLHTFDNRYTRTAKRSWYVLETVAGGGIEHDEGIEGDRNGDVVDDENIQVCSLEGKLAVVILTVGIQYNHNHSHQRLHNTELKRPCVHAQ